MIHSVMVITVNAKKNPNSGLATKGTRILATSVFQLKWLKPAWATTAPASEQLQRCEEVGAALAAGLVLGIF